MKSLSRAFYALAILVISQSTIFAQVFQIGSGTGSNGSTSYPAPLQDYYEAQRAQYLYSASEMIAAGMSAGTITAIGFDVTSLVAGDSVQIEQLTIRIGQTSTSSLSSTGWETVTNTLFGPADYTPVLDTNTFTLSTPLVWNGSDNIIIEVCGGDPNNGSESDWTNNYGVTQTTGLGFNASRTYRADNSGNLCSSTSTIENGSQTTRPNILFTITIPGCTNPATAGVASASASLVCPFDPVTFSLAGATSGQGATYQWQNSIDSVNWTNVAGATSGVFTTNVLNDEYYRCIVQCSGGTPDTSNSVLVEQDPSPMPYFEDFEFSNLGQWTATPSATTVYSWRTFSGSTSSGSTGPNIDHTLGTASGIYVYTEASSGGSGDTAILTSPCFDVSGFNQPALSFWYHMYGSSIDTLWVEATTDGANWTVIDQLDGPQQTNFATIDPWKKRTTPFSTSVKAVRFRLISQGCCAGDAALDDIEIFDLPLNDAGIVTLETPTSPTTAGSQSVSVRIGNFGAANLTSAQVTMELNGAALPAYSFTGNVLPGDSSASVNIGSANFVTGFNDLVIYTSLPNGQIDGEPLNDTLKQTILACNGGFSGTYTLGGGSADFTDFSEMILLMQNCGISGPTTVNVNPGTGPFNEQVIFQNIGGLSATNTLTINGAGETIQFDPTFSDERIVGFDGVKHVTLDSLVIMSMGTTYGYGVHFTNQSDSNTISNCIIDLGSISSTSSTSNGGIVFSGSVSSPTTAGDNGNFVTISNNEIIGSASGGGYYGIIIRGSFSAPTKGVVIEDNKIWDWYSRAIDFDEVDSITVQGNDIGAPNRSSVTTRYGIYASSSNTFENNLFEGNYFHDFHSSPSTSTIYAFYLSSSDGSIGSPNQFANNIIGNMNSNGDQYGFYNVGSDYVDFVHNTVALDQGNSTSTLYETYGFYQSTTATGINIFNNIFLNNRQGLGENYGLYFNTTSSTISSNYNVIHVDTNAPNNFTGYYSANQTSITDWQAVNTNAFDQNSWSENPQFVDPMNDDFSPNQPAFDNAALNLNVPIDFNGASRTSTPDPGAIEFTVPPTDATIVQFLSPIGDGVCGFGSSESVKVVIKNLGASVVTSVNLSYSLNQGTLVTELISGLNLAINDTAHITFSAPADMSTQNEHEFIAIINLTGDVNSSNDTISYEVKDGNDAPYFEDFETLANEDNGNLSNGWYGNQTSDPRWEAEDASGFNENSSATGPLVDHTIGVGGIYMFMESSSGAAGQGAELVSTCINLSTVNNPFLEFWYHMHGAAMGDLFIEISTDDGLTFTTIDSIQGQQQANQADPWLKREINLCDYTGQTIRVQFRGVDNSTSFTSDFAIDDFRVYDRTPFHDAAVTRLNTPHEYSQIPIEQATSMSFDYSARIANLGTETNTGVQAALVTNSGIPINQTEPIGTMLACSDDTLISFGSSVTPTSIGTYESSVIVVINETDSNGLNDTLTSSFEVTDSIYSRDDDNRIGGIGANAGTLELGQIFKLAQGDTITRIQANLDGNSGDSARFKVYTLDTLGLPDSLIFATEPFVLSGLIDWYTYDFCELTEVVATDYFVAVEQMTPSSNVGLGYTQDVFTPNRMFYGVEGGTWTPLETAGFENAYMIRVTLGDFREFNGIDVSIPIFCQGDSVELSSEPYAGGYIWNTGEMSQSIFASSEGWYTLTATKANGCEYTDSIYIEDDTISVSITGTTQASCGVDNGTATALGVNGIGSIAYNWDNGDMTATADSLAAGVYDVTVTDSLGCTASVQANVSNSGSPSIFFTSVTDVICGGVASGAINSNVTGGASPYNYSWSEGSSGTSISNLDPGAYSLTITDALNCVVIEDTVVTGNDTLMITSAVASNVTCNGFADGTADIEIDGGLTGYTYHWSNAATTQDLNNLPPGTYTVTVTDNVGCTVSDSLSITEPTQLVIGSINSTSPNCNGESNGSLQVNASGGTPSYNYLWSNASTGMTNGNIPAGTYSVVVTDDNGCTTSGSSVVTEPTLLVSSISSSMNVSCNGGNDGMATVTTGGGTPGYTYLWNGGSTSTSISSLSAGTYSVVSTDANGCTSTASVSITEPSALSFFFNNTDVDCNGNTNGAIDMSNAGGTSPYSYSWTGGATTEDLNGIGAGTYTVVVTDDNGCTYTSPGQTINEPTAISFTTGTVTNVDCFGEMTGSITTSASGGTTPYGYSWTGGGTGNSVMNIGAGTYTVVLTDANGCTETLTETVTENPQLTGSFTSTDETCEGDMDGSVDCTASGGVTPYNYNWSNSATTALISNLMPGVYDVTITDDVGCTITDQATVSSQFPLPMPMIMGDEEVCGGDSAMLDAGQGYTNYDWSTGDTTQMVNITSSGMISVMVTDMNGCMNSDSFNVTVFDLLTISIDSSSVTCKGNGDGSLTANVGGGVTPYSYAWDDPMMQSSMTASNLDEGSYSVMIVDAEGCEIDGSASIGYQFENPIVDLGNDTLVPFPWTLDAGSHTSYMWNIGAMTQTISVVGSGYYSVTVTDDNGCAGSDTIKLDVWTVGVGDVVEATTVKLYPNPTFGQVNIEFDAPLSEDLEITVMSMNGEIAIKEMLTNTGSSATHKLDLSTLAKGVYMIELRSGDMHTVERISIQ